MAVRRKNKGYMVDFAMHKKRYRVFGFVDKKEAEAWEMEARAAVMRGQPLPRGPQEIPEAPDKPKGVTMRDFFRQVVPLQWAGCKAAAKQARTAEMFVEYVGETTLVKDALTGPVINQYVLHLQETGRSGATINRRLAGVSALLKHALSLRLIDHRPLLPTQKAQNGRLRWFTRRETELIFKTLDQWGQGEWMYFFMFLLDTGCRPSEAVRLELRDFNNDFTRVTFHDTKNGVVRAVPLTTRLRGLDFSAMGNRPFGWVKPHGVRLIWDKLRAHLEFLDDAVIYTFRHTCASWLVQHGVDLTRVKTWMGHTSIQTTMIYAHLAPKHLDEALDAIEGVT